jgi:hypothetical protein
VHKTRFYQLLPFPTDTGETHEALINVQVFTGSKEQFLFVIGSEKMYCFIANPN